VYYWTLVHFCNCLHFLAGLALLKSILT
jgi:hypothetical protein